MRLYLVLVSLVLGCLLGTSSACRGPQEAPEESATAAAGSAASSGPHEEARPAGEDPSPLRFSGIPDSDKAKLTQMYAVVADYLTTALGRSVTYVHVPDYTGAVTALAANKVDFVWLGGVTAVQAEARTRGQVEYVATREADLKFRSYLVANAAVVAQGRFSPAPQPLAPMPLADLAALRSGLAQSSFSFGAKSSTSGHIMPRYFLSSPAVGFDVDGGFRGRVNYQLQGGHRATLSAVASGAVDAGVLNYKTWEGADDETKRQAPVVYVTPEYVDYVVVAHDRMGVATIAALRDALVSLDEAQPQHAAVLAAFSAKRFVAADAAQWSGIRKVVQELTAAGALN
ncbi:MAG: hypothetical protein B7733_21715 [Myxococcales bacterium FL481]|nr:MAG: hypothetical protein B7733_21715 [Myxococcales bacterium FL481]